MLGWWTSGGGGGGGGGGDTFNGGGGGDGGGGTFKGGGGVMEQVVVGVPAGCDMIRDINMICATRYVF